MQAQAQQTTMDPPAVPHSSACADGGSSIDVASSSSVAPRAVDEEGRATLVQPQMGDDEGVAVVPPPTQIGQ
eukprot:14765364-Alexandrium_andersonii.AAC.1